MMMMMKKRDDNDDVDDDNDDDYEYKKFHFTLSPSTFAFSPRCIQFRWLDL